MITSKELRNNWIKFYESKGHVNIGAVSLIGDVNCDSDVSATDIICNYKKDTCIFECDNCVSWAANHLLNYSVNYDKKIRPGETVTIKFCYHKDRVIMGMMSSIMTIGMEDDNGRYWPQPLFAPTEKIYDSRMVTYKDYIAEVRPNAAIECFKNPMLW